MLEVQSFHPLRTGRNHLRVLAAASGVDDARVDEVLALVDSRTRPIAGRVATRSACASASGSRARCSAIPPS